MAKLLHRVGALAARRSRTVLVAWLAVLLVLGGLALGFRGTFSSEFTIPGTESQDAAELIAERVPGTNPDAAAGKVVFRAPDGGTLRGGAPQAAVAEAVRSLNGVEGVGSATDPYATGTVSRDGSVAYTNLQFTVPQLEITAQDTEAVDEATTAAARAGVGVDFGGAAAPVESEIPIGEVAGVAVALVVLAVTFGSLLAAGMPLLTGVFGVGIGALGITLASGFTDLTDVSITLAAMLGLAVGIDYCLFILSRHRTQVADGMPVEASIAKAVGTAGSAVVFAGLTVIIALCALAVTGVPFLLQMGLGGAATIAVAVLLSLTATPALLALAGERAVRGRSFSERDHRSADVKPTMGARWVGLVTRHRIVAVGLVAVVLGALAIPALDMRLGLPGDESAGPQTTKRQAYDLVARGFGPGANGPLTVAVDLDGVRDQQGAVAAAVDRLRGLDGIATVAPPQLVPGRDLAIVSVIPTGGPSAASTEALVDGIRGAAPEIRAADGARVLVTGQTATNIDISQRMSDALAPYLVVVVGLAVLLLMVAFRSVLVPLTAIGGFLLTIVASFGVVTLVFQEGVLAGLIGVEQTGPLVSLLPILIIGVIFGLAMDYQVFLVSRMREEFAHGADAQDAVRDGFRHSARVVTAAGLIMISVFAGFVVPDDPIIKSIGVAFAAGIAIDAFLIRMTLIPALMSLMGRAAWWMPRWLDRLVPNVDVEGTSLEPQPATAATTTPVAET